MQWYGGCFCGNSYGKYGTSSCVNECSPDAGFYGGWRNCIYDVDGVIPAPTPKPTSLEPLVCTPDDWNTFYDFKDGLTAGNGQLTFQVKASNDAHIALGSASITYSGGRQIPEHYEIVLGGWSNSKSLIRSTTHGATMAEYSGAVLSGSEYRKFRISWDSVVLTVEHYIELSGWVVMMQVTHDGTTSSYSIERAMVMTAWATGCWEYMSPSYLFLGCYADSDDRDLPINIGGGHTHDQCHKVCMNQGYAYFGMQWYGGCFCGNSYGKYGTSSCVNECSPDAGFYGGWRNCIYDVDGVIPAPTPKPTSLEPLVCTPDDWNTFYDFKDGLTAGNGQLTFQVKASNDAHIALGSASITYSGGRQIPEHYEIVLGGWSNSKSLIRSTTHGATMAEYSGAVLSGSEYRKFRISWDSVVLTVEHYIELSGWVVMMQVTHDGTTSSYSIERAMVMTAWATGCWEYMTS